MSEQVFKPGDVVALKSGGPALTVQGYADDGDVVAFRWNEATGEYQRHEVGEAFLLALAGGVGPATRSTIDRAGLIPPFKAIGGVVSDAANVHVCDARPSLDEANPKAKATAEAIAAALNAAAGRAA